jgi:hypothetical protein
LPRGDSFDLDFHTVPANTQEEPLEKHYVSSRSRRQQGILVFLARDAPSGFCATATPACPRPSSPTRSSASSSSGRPARASLPPNWSSTRN